MAIELSVVMPCLNEERTVAICVKKAFDAFRREKIEGEVVVVDNGSTDNSAERASKAGARVINHHKKGYGSALKKGIEEARGKFIIMADADNTYDFSGIASFVTLLRGGADLVMGSRFKGKIHPGAMPLLHRWLGTPVLTFIINLFFHAKISDVNCGMRGFRKDAIEKLHLKSNGMEFASEMLIKASQRKFNISETPIHYYAAPGDRESHLKSFRDGWRHLRFMLLFCPKYLFLFPGILLSLAGLALIILTFFKTVTIFRMPLGLSTFVLSHALFFMGIQIALFGVYAIMLSRARGIIKNDRLGNYLMRYFTLEKGLLAGVVLLIAGIAVLGITIWRFATTAPAPAGIHVGLTRMSIFSIFVILLGVQLIFSSFYLSSFKLDETLK